MGNQVMSVQGTSQFPITPHDTNTIAQDSGNTKGFVHCYIHNRSAGGEIRVMAVDDAVATTIYLNQGATHPVPVKQVFATSPVPPTNLTGIGALSKV